MTPRAELPCPFAAEVEAGHDGRLGPIDVAQLDRHVAVCAPCRALRVHLQALRVEARFAANVGDADLAQRRARTALLQRAARPGPSTAWVRTHLAPALVAVVAVAAVGGALWRQRAARAAAQHLLARVEASAGATWSRAADAREESIRLADGVLRVAVPHQHRGHRFVVVLPDGQIEVRGTRFEVEVRDHRTLRLDVAEGLVALRLVGRGEQLIAAGSRWAPALPARDADVVAARDVPPAPLVRASGEPTLGRSQHAVRPSRPAAVADTLSSFTAGLRALQRGDLAVAADSFATFERTHAADDRAEDAGYLRLAALRRTGSTVAASTAAESYLRRYPRGARRWEALAYLVGLGRSGLTCDELAALDAEFGADAGRRSALRPLLAGCRR